MSAEIRNVDDIWVAVDLLKMWATERVRNSQGWSDLEWIYYSPKIVARFQRRRPDTTQMAMVSQQVWSIAIIQINDEGRIVKDGPFIDIEISL